MERETQENQNNINCKQKDVSKKITHLINETLKNPGDNFGDRIDYIINKVISSINPESISNEQVQKKIFHEICDFLNRLFKEIQIKKFYNNIPKIDLNSYSKKNLGNQIINNIYGKERKIFYKNEINGGDCNYWSILLKNLFDKLKSKGLNIQDRIFAYDINRGHSGVIIKFQGETYLADVSGFNQIVGKTISPVSDLNGLYETKNFTKFSFNRKNDFGLRYFDEKKDFIDYINSKKINSAAIEFNPRLVDGKEKNIRIQLFKKFISLRIDGKEKRYIFDKNFDFSKVCKNSHEVLDCLLKGIIADKNEKHEIRLYFDMIRDKIDPKKINEIFN